MKDLAAMYRLPPLSKPDLMFKNSLTNSASTRFFSSVFLLLVLNILIKPLWIFAIDRQVQNIVGLDEYGKYFALFNITVVFNFLLDPGITTFYNLTASSLTDEKPPLFQSALLKLYLGVGYAILLVILAYATGIKSFQLLFLLGMMQFLFSMFVFLRSHITAMQLFSSDAWLSVLDKSIMIICCGVLIYRPALFGPINITRFVLLQVIAILVSICVAAGIIISHGGLGKTVNIKSSLSFLRSALPYGLIVLVMSAINRQDAFLLDKLFTGGGDHEAGIYASAYRLVDAFNMIGYLVASFLLPYISRNWNKDVQLKRVVILSRNLLLVPAIAIVMFVYFYAPALQKLLYHSDNLYQVRILQLCIPTIIGYTLVQVYGTVLTASGNIHLFLKLSIPFLVLNLVLNVLFIPAYGAQACSIIAIITQLCYGILLMIVGKRKLSENALIIYD